MMDRPQARRGILFVLSAPSGAGKSTLVQRAKAELDFSFIVSCTTRPPREGEEDGHDYYFLDEAEFERRVQDGFFLEYARVHGGAYYGTPREDVVRNLSEGKDVFLDIDVEGARQVRAIDDPVLQQARVDIFIMPPSLEELERRLRSRGTETDDQIQVRLATAAEEMPHWRSYQYTMLTRSREEDMEKLKSIILAERIRTERYL